MNEGNLLKVLAFSLIFFAAKAFAGYQVNTSVSTAGTDSSGASSSILRLEVLSASNSSNYVTFKISKRDGSAFSTSGTISMKLACGTAGCDTMASTSMSAGSFFKTFRVYMPRYTTGPVGEDVYGRYEASNGYWTQVGPIRVFAPALGIPGTTSTTEIASATARLGWHSVTAAESYRFQVTEEPQFDTNGDGTVCTNCVANDITTHTNTLVTGLTPGTRYRWRVRAGNATTGQGSPWSHTRLFNTVSPTVHGVSPLSTQLGAETIFTVTGNNLPAGMGFWVDQCTGITELSGGNASSRQFRCTPSFSPGLKNGEVKDSPGGTSLFSFQVDVEAGMTVASVSPTTATLGESTVFTVFGNQLSADMGFWIDQCEDIIQLSGGSPTEQRFRCTPSHSTGLKSGEVKTSPGGILLNTFTLEVINPSSAQITSIAPQTAILNEPTIFTLEGRNLTAGMGFWIHDCESVIELPGGTATRRQFRCTPRNTSGLKPGVVKTAPGGTVLHHFKVEVVAPPRITSVSPSTASLDQATIFTVLGEHLPEGMGFWIDQCSSMTELSGGSTVSRRFQCTPSFSTGLKAGEVKVSPSGSLLHAFSINVTAQPHVTSVTPQHAELDSPTIFTVQGSGLPTGMDFWLEGGTDLMELSGGNPSSRQFQVTPSLTAGQKAGEIRLSTGGPLLKSFTVAISAGTNQFLNVAPWAQSAAGFLVTSGIVHDPPSHDLRGTDQINRAELATLIYRALGGGVHNADANFAAWHGRLLVPPFSDVRDATTWYYRPATYLGNLAGSNSITVFDRAPGVFRPVQTISRAWSLKALLEAWDIEPLSVPLPVIRDVPASHPAAGYIYKALELGLIENNGDFRPDDLADRQELFVMLHRLMDVSANLMSQGIAIPVPLHPEDFDDDGAYLARSLGSRFAQPVLNGVQAPSVAISAAPLVREDTTVLEGLYTMELEAVIANLDPNTYVDAGGTSHTANPFYAWSAEMGSLFDLSTGGPPFSRVKWIAPVDFSPQDGSNRDVHITLYCGDSLGSEVKAVHTIQFSNNPSLDSTLPVVTIDEIPSGSLAGQVITLSGTAKDRGNSERADFGILPIQLSFSANGGSAWLPIGAAAASQGGKWEREWQLPDQVGTLLVRARATNGRGNDRETQTSFTLQANLTLSGIVIDLASNPVPDTVVTLGTQGVAFASRTTDSFGAFHFSRLNGAPLEPMSSYTLTAKAGFDLATAQNLVLSETQPVIREKLVIGADSTPPITDASVPSGIYSVPFSVSLNCDDDDSGCGTTFYTTDGSYPDGSSSVYAGPIAMDSDTTLRFFSVDAVGNREQTLTHTYYFKECSYAVNPSTESFPQNGGNGRATVVTLGDCTWTGVSNAPWIVLTSPPNQSGIGLIEYFVEANTSGQARAGTISVMGEQVVIQQSASQVHSLVIHTSGNGSGRVTSDPVGIDCGSECSAEFSGNLAVTLIPNADAGSIFTGWSGGDCFGTLPCTVNLTENEMVTATFSTSQGLHVLSTNPSHGDTGVATNSNIRINFSGAIQQGHNFNDIELRVTGADPVPLTKYLYPSDGLLYLDPGVRLEDSTNYTVTIPANAIEESTGHPLAVDHVFSFTTRQPGSSQLFISGYPVLLMEGDRARVTIWYDQTMPRDRFINLQASMASELDIPSQVVIPAGETGIEFEVEATRNYLADSNRTVTLSAEEQGGQQTSLEIQIKDDDPILGNALRIAATSIIAENNGNGIFEADEVADFLVEVHNSSGTFQVNTAVEVEIVNTFNMRTLGSGTCNIGGLGSGRIGGCDVSLLADEQLPTGAYWLKITLTSNTDTTVDYARVNVVNNSLPDFRVSSQSVSRLIVEPGQVLNKRFVAVHRGDGFSPELPTLNVYIEEEGTRETLLQTYAEVRGDSYNEWTIQYEIPAPSVPGTYRIWGEINPAGPNQIEETVYTNNTTSVQTLVVRDENQAPMLGAIGNKAIHAGHLLTFAATAVDPNPEDTISFSLNNAPAGASIDPVTGLFRWIPDEDQGQAEYRFTIIAEEDGEPALSDAETITVRVDKRANLGVSMTDHLNEAVPGQILTYTIEVSNEGPNAVGNALVSSVVPAEMTAASWSCTASAGSTCGAGGAGDLSDNPHILAGGLLRYTVTGRVLDSASGRIVNSCNVSVPMGVVDPIISNNSATDVNTLRQLDFGDAPDSNLGSAWTFPTRLNDNGARHGLVPRLFLGASVDSENDGRPHLYAGGDATDEDGVIFPEPLVTCETAEIQVVLSASGFLDAWIDFNADGDWDDLNEQFLSSEFVPTGTNAITLSVPCDAMPTTETFVRFRLSSDGNHSYDGLALDGEVEDYAVSILGLDFGDAPDPRYPTLNTSDGARHVLASGLFLGQTVDSEPNGQPDSAANGDDQNRASDEDGVVFDSAMRPGVTASVRIHASAPGFVDAWIDFNGDGDWADADEQIFNRLPVIAGVNSLNYSIPLSAVEDFETYARVRLSSVGGLTIDGLAQDGEVEDYQVRILERCTIPQLVTSPVAASKCRGESVSFTVSVTGTGPMSYQWRHNGVDISGATDPNYTIVSLVESDAGDYDCRISNPCGNLTSTSATLEVKDAVTLSGQPQSLRRCPGESARFSVTATGSEPLTYQWHKNGIDIPGARAPVLTLNQINSDDSGVYSCSVSNACNSVTSSSAELTLQPLATITQQPSGMEVCSGDRAMFSIVATGPVSYQWHKEGHPLPGATGPVLSFGAVGLADAGSYSCVVTSECTSIASEPAVLSVNREPAIQSHPSPSSSCHGDLVTFSVMATGSEPLSYQWRKNGSDILGATNSSYIISSIGSEDAADYTVAVSNACGSVTSSIASLEIFEPVSILEHPDSQSFCLGDQIELSIRASGEGPIAYQWYKDEVLLEGQSTHRLTLLNLTMADEGEYRCEVSGACGVETTNTASLIFDGDLSAQTNPRSQSLGLTPPIFSVDIECAIPMVEATWVTDPPTAMVSEGTTVTLIPPPSETTTLEVSVTDGSGTVITDQGVLLVSLNSGYEDFNMDGCNNIQDLWDLGQFWNEYYPNDPTNDGDIDILDLLFINLKDPMPCP